MMQAKDKHHESKVFLTVENDTKVYRSVQSHPFNRVLDITYAASDAIDSLIASFRLRYFRVNFDLSWLLDGAVGAAMRSKQLSGISIHANNSPDSFCLHDGVLVMRLSRQTYQRAGLDGRRCSKTPEQWDIRIDFSGAGFVGSKAMQRLEKSLTRALNQPIDMMVTLSDEADIPSELAGHERDCAKVVFTEPRRAPRFECLLRGLQHKEKKSSQWDNFHEEQEELQTYLALLTLPQTVPVKPDAYISTYSYEGGPLTEVTTTRFTGLLSSSQVVKLVRSLASMSGSAWYAIHIRGFEEPPITWAEGEHGTCIGGDNHITIVSWTDADSESSRKLAMWEIVGRHRT